jgi:hypothetical protein
MTTKAYDYNRIDPSKVQNVEFIPTEAQEWKDYKKRIYNRDKNRKTEAQKQRIKNIKNNYQRFKKFETEVEYLLRNKQDIRSKIDEYIDHLRQAEFNYEGENSYGNKRVSTPYTSDKNGAIRDIDWNKTHCKTVNHSRDEQSKILVDEDSLDKVKRILRSKGYDIVDEEQFYKSVTYSIPVTYRSRTNQSRIDELRRVSVDRKEVLRFVWHRHLADVQDFHFKRAEAYLRDLESKMSKDHDSGDTKKAFEFENRVRQSTSDFNLPQNNRVMRVEMKSGNVRYKEVDVHTELSSKPLIIEVFTNREIETKKKQLNNYIQLAQQHYDTDVEGMLVTRGFLPENPDELNYEVNTLSSFKKSHLRDALSSDKYPKIKLEKQFEVAGVAN